VQSYTQRWIAKTLAVIEPIPEPRREDYPEEAAYKGARKRFARRKISHQKVMSEAQYRLQMKAKTPMQFFEAEALHVESGNLYWATKPRCAVNLRQLLQTDTIEFRHFPGTINPTEVRNSVDWCRDYLNLALTHDLDVDPIKQLWEPSYRKMMRPTFRPYVHWMEERYQRTCAHKVGPEAAAKAIAEILAEDARKK
jgi:hypothetical protein